MQNLSRYLITTFILGLIGFVMWYFADIVAYLFIAWLLSMIGRPLMDFFQRIRIKKLRIGSSFAAILTLLTYFTVLGIIIAIFVPTIVNQAQNLASANIAQAAESLVEEFTDYTQRKFNLNRFDLDKNDSLFIDTMPINLQKRLNSFAADFQAYNNDVDSIRSVLASDTSAIYTAVDVPTTLENDLKRLSVDFNAYADYNPQRFDSTAIDKFDIQEEVAQFLNPQSALNLAGSIVGTAGNVLIGLFSIIFIAFFFLKDDRLLTRVMVTLIPKQYSTQVRKSIDDVSYLLTRYFGGILLQITIITIVVTLGLMILGIENALLIGLFAALINVIPYLGPILGAAFASLMVVASNLDMEFYNIVLPLLGKVIFVFGCMQMLDNFILQPMIFSKSIQAHPLEIFIVILVGAKLGGILGMVSAIPIYTIIRVVTKAFLNEFKLVPKELSLKNSTVKK